jgi:hypothetical protein
MVAADEGRRHHQAVRVVAFDGVWWATREEIADWYLANHALHIG